MAMKRIITVVALAVVAAFVAGCGGAANDERCLTPAQVDVAIAKIDTYSWYDPSHPKTLERLSPENARAVLDVEGRACESATAAAPPTATGAAKFTGVDRENYAMAKDSCSAFPASKLAKEYGVANDPPEIAMAVSKGYRKPFQQAVFDGCLAGLGR